MQVPFPLSQHPLGLALALGPELLGNLFALREISDWISLFGITLFGAVIAVVVLKEPLRLTRIGAALLILCGLVLIRPQ